MKLSDEIINSLSLNLREKIKSVNRENIEEIRLRINKPLIINGNLQDYFYNEKRKCLDTSMDNAYIVTKDDIEQTFQIICKYSIHSFMDDIKKGFITLRGGHRVGIVGKAIVENGRVENIKHISSLNIRISKEIRNCSDKVMNQIIKSPTEINNTIIITIDINTTNFLGFSFSFKYIPNLVFFNQCSSVLFFIFIHHLFI